MTYLWRLFVAHVRDWLDCRAERGWFAPAGTYDGTKRGRPQPHVWTVRREAGKPYR